MNFLANRSRNEGTWDKNVILKTTHRGNVIKRFQLSLAGLKISNANIFYLTFTRKFNFQEKQDGNWAVYIILKFFLEIHLRWFLLWRNTSATKRNFCRVSKNQKIAGFFSQCFNFFFILGMVLFFLLRSLDSQAFLELFQHSAFFLCVSKFLQSAVHCLNKLTMTIL